MDAGRALDAQIHEILQPHHNIDGESFCTGDHERSASCEWLPIPHYSTDETEVFGLIAFLRDHNTGIHLEAPPNKDVELWGNRIHPNDGYTINIDRSHVCGKSIPHALCLLILKVKLTQHI